MWRIIRISVLVVVLAVVARQMLMNQSDLEWKDNFYVALFPVNADGSDVTQQYIKTLTKDDFIAMEAYFAEEANRYGLGMRRPIAIQLGSEVKTIPPAPPASGSSIAEAIVWSLKFRWFAWNNTPEVAVRPDIRMYLLFYNPQTHPRLSHSTALNKGRIGRVNLFASRGKAKQNLVVTAHELLHTLTASDKYDLSTGQPIYPDGYADPGKTPRYPQYFAELMGGYVPISEEQSKIPISLKQTLIGYKTAREIGWVR